MKTRHSLFKMFNHNFLILLIVLSIFVLIGFGCGGSSSDEGTSSDTSNDNSNGVELSGDAASLALSATYDFYTGTGNPEAEIEDDPRLGKIVRSILEIGFSKEATVGEVNELLDSIDGRIISMIEGVAIIIVRIPDPGSIPALEKVIQDVESNPIVRFVGMGHIPEFSALPNNYVYDHTDMTMIDHNLAVRGHAAWNLRNALQNIGLYSPPMIIVPDLFGKGRPVSDYGFDVTGTDFETASTFPDDELHGYHVIGIIGADYGGSNTDRGWATGLYPAVSPNTLQLRVIDFANGITDEETDDRLIQLIKENSSYNIVVNTSYGFPAKTQNQVDTFCVPEFAKKEALKWIEKVRDAGVEGKFVHITAAGNTWIPGDTDANVASRYAAAKLLGGLEDCWLGVYPCTPVDNITNVLVVENQRNSTDTPYRPICLNFDSKLGGDISGIGTDVWSLLDPEATAGNFSGTSMASPQVAALAAYVWALKPTLSNQDVIKILANTSRQVASWDPSLHANCSAEPPAPIIDAYAAVLAVDTPSDNKVRKTLLDIADNFGTEVSDRNFNEHDIELLLANIEIGQGELNYSRYDLNGDGYTGGDKWERFDLDINNPPAFTNVTQDIEGTAITFNEEGLTDMEVLCYYAYSDMYSGDVDRRKSLLDGKCPSQPQVNVEAKIGTVTGNYGIRYTEDPRDGDVIITENFNSETLGTSISPTETCQYDGGQSTGSGAVVLAGEICLEDENSDCIEGHNAVGTLSAAVSGSSVTFNFSASAETTTEPDLDPTVTYTVWGSAGAGFSTDPQQVVMLIENNTTMPIDILISWSASAIITRDPGEGSASGSAGFVLNIDGIDDPTIEIESSYTDYGDYTDGTPSGLQTISLDPGKHCLFLSIGVSADAQVSAFPEIPSYTSSAAAGINASVSVSVQ